MANTTISWHMREALPYFRQDGRLAVYTAFLLHANERGRAWPSIVLLMKETGYSRAYVVAAKQWLQEVGALVPVPEDKRIDGELGGHRRDVMQISGRAVIDGKLFTLLYGNSSENEPLPENGSDSEPLNSSKSERSESEPEVITDKDEVDPREEDSGAGAPPEPAKPLTEWQQQLKAMAEPMCSLTGDDINIERIKRRAGTIAAVLIKAGYGPSDLPVFKRLWAAHDWRGQKNQPPTLEQVQTELPRLINLHGRGQPGSNGNGSATSPVDITAPFGRADQANQEFAARLKAQRAAQEKTR